MTIVFILGALADDQAARALFLSNTAEECAELLWIVSD
jgi:hypothetical protein